MTTQTTFTSLFSLGDRVNVDGDKSIIGVVVGFCWVDSDGCSVKVSWFHDRKLSHV